MFEWNLVEKDPPLQPADLEMLHGVLTSACEKRRIPLASAEAQDLALLLVSLFQSGVRSESALCARITSTILI